MRKQCWMLGLPAVQIVYRTVRSAAGAHLDQRAGMAGNIPP